MTDNNLSKRAGLNIGIEPSLLPYVRAVKGSPILVDPNGDTLIAEATDKAARVITLEHDTGLGGGVVIATDSGGADLNKIVHLIFVDELGNEVEVATSDTISSILTNFHVNPNVTMSEYDFFCLAAGEKIIARVTTAPPA